MEPEVLVDLDDGILALTLNRPSKHNAINFQMIDLLLDQINRSRRDQAIRVVLLRGAGPSFCAGDDVVSMGSTRELPPGSHPTREYQQRLAREWYELEKPTVVSLRGHCYGMAHDLALAADFRIVSSRITFGDLRAKRALPIASGSTFLLPRMIGTARAKYYIMTGESMDAATMYELGLCTRLADDTDLDETAYSFAKELASAPTRSLGLIKHAILHNAETGFAEALDRELELYDVITEDRREGFRSFREGRQPRFTGT